MASRRMVDPAIWHSETFASWTYRQRILFIGLFSNADDQGRLRAHPALVRSLVFPYEDITLKEIEEDLAIIAGAESIHLYEVGNHTALQIIKWWEYQKPQWAYPSKIDPPEGWNDRLRYRKDNEVSTDNWVDSLPNVLGKALPKESGNGSGETTGNAVQSSVVGVVKEVRDRHSVSQPPAASVSTPAQLKPEEGAPSPPPPPLRTITLEEIRNPDQTLLDVWSELQPEIAGQMQRATYDKYVRFISPVCIKDRCAVFITEREHVAEWCNGRLKIPLRRTLAHVLDGVDDFSVAVRPQPGGT